MPVTIKVAEHDAAPVRQSPLATPNNVKTSQEALELLYQKDASNIGPILNTASGAQTSLTDSVFNDTRLRIEDHGLVRAAYYAYSGHHHLVIRPEDIWFAVLTQFSYYVNANSEKLRSSFVSHKGKKGLIVRDPGQPDMGLMCRNMTKLIDQNIVDPKLREWILPSFTTTTLNDEVVASVIMMGTLQKYFEYIFDATCCGIPTVTLLGELSDWEDIQRRIEKLSEYGREPSRFCDLLRPVLKYMVASFTDGPSNQSVVDFWSHMIDRNNDSGMDELTGWMVAFCFWDEDGKCLAASLYNKTGRPTPAALMPLGQPYHTVDFNEVPAGFVSVPVAYIDLNGLKIDAKLLAGFVGYEDISYATHAVKSPGPTEDKSPPARTLGGKVSSALGFGKKKRGASAEKTKTQDTADVVGSSTAGDAGQSDTLKPVTGWWMYEVKNARKSSMLRKDFYAQKLGSWAGGASTGYVQEDGQMKVKDGLPSDLDL